MMTNYVAGLVAFMALCVLCVISAPATRDEESSQEIKFRYLKKFVDDLRVMVDNVNKLTSGEISLDEMTKRQGKQSGAWDMDYGWGGGRFGKRNSGNTNSQAGAKRYDMYGMTGRFGRDVSRAEAQMRNNDH
jgi:hypothetical protein